MSYRGQMDPVSIYNIHGHCVVLRRASGKDLSSSPYHPLLRLPPPGWTDFSRSGKSAAEFAQEPSQFARMAPGPSRRRGRPAPPTPRIWLTAGALLAVACQGGGERPLETSAGLSLAPWGLAEPAAAAARASEPVIAEPAVGQIEIRYYGLFRGTRIGQERGQMHLNG